MKANLDYMRIKFGFTILDIECLVDLKGLLTYIAERIQLGKLCLFCDKQFRTAESCQMHMRMKGHCMMPFDDNTEFEQFYDFSRQYRNMGLKFKSIKNEEETTMTDAEERKIQNDQKLVKATNKGSSKQDDEASDSWEDVDEEDADMEEIDENDEFEDVEEAESDEEESKQSSASSNKEQKKSAAASITEEEKTESFTLIDTNGSK